MSRFKIGNTEVGDGCPTYFIAEIGSNHCGSLDKAKELCSLAKQSGADCAKFQHYRAETLASGSGFAHMDSLAHYTDNPYNVFKKYEVPWEWTPILKEHCDKIGIEFMSTPYDLEAVDHLEPYVNAYKIGSGDITYKGLIDRVGSKGKPVILSTGASSWQEVDQAIGWILSATGYEGAAIPPIAVLQCNTNYTASSDNISNLNLAWLGWEREYVQGLSDHTQIPQVIDVAVALGAKIIERHFTDNWTNPAPDTPFALDPHQFGAMVRSVRLIELAMGDGVKKVEENEKETVILQRRCIRTNQLLRAGTIIKPEHLVCLRPAPVDSLPPYEIDWVLHGGHAARDIPAGDYLREKDVRKAYRKQS